MTLAEDHREPLGRDAERPPGGVEDEQESAQPGEPGPIGQAGDEGERPRHLADTRFVGSARDKMERAIRGYVDYTIDAPGAAAFLVQCWALASQKPLIRDLLVRRRERTVTVAALIGWEAVDAGELPPDFDVEAMARGFTALLDGLVLQRVEEGDSYRRADMERRALAFLDLVAPRRSDGGRS